MPLCVLLLLGLTCAFSTLADIQYAGVNLSGTEFGQNVLPGNYGSQYIYPNQAEVDYFRSKGMNTIRLPFRWERLQRTNNAALNVTELSHMNTFVSATTAKGVYVILDPHNFARYYPNPRNDYQTATDGLLGTTVPYANFADFWSRVAAVYKTNDHVIFGLMNEPANMATEEWLDAANAAIAAIRATGATNLILVPGNAYTGAWTWFDNWYGTPNAIVMTNIVDSGNNFAFEVHQYVDSDGSGTTTNISGGASVGVTRLSNFTQWLKAHHYKGFLGEFGIANVTVANGIGGATISNMLAHVQTNSDVWLGWTWWAGGPWWAQDMIFLLDPANLGQPGQTDKPAMTVLKNFIPIPIPVLAMAANQFQFITQSGFVYQPQTSTDLTGDNWANLGSAIMGSNQTVSITMPVNSGSQGFYRVSTSHAP
ncbi:MAG: glycoside hydrolase family 5 protein [Limisphaerales bacterium]